MNDNQEPLMQKAQQSLDAAQLLIQQSFYDFAVSRAYYAMFYAVEALLADLGQSYSSHGAVIAAFGREFAKTGKLPVELHRQLIDAQDARNIGDYGMRESLTADQVTQIYNSARGFLTQVEQYRLRESSSDT